MSSLLSGSYCTSNSDLYSQLIMTGVSQDILEFYSIHWRSKKISESWLGVECCLKKAVGVVPTEKQWA